jgi:poly-gamma-glutamate biosynthesis protein PgsC/CapC
MLPLDPTSTSIAIGLIVSLGFTELFGLAAGGMVVPGYLALSLDKPGCVLTTLLAALVTYLVVAFISKFAIVYGRRRTVLMILFGFLIGAAFRAAPALAASGSVEATGAEASAFAVVGFIIPGLIALWIQRQGIIETFSILLTTTVVVRLVLIVLGMEAPS